MNDIITEYLKNNNINNIIKDKIEVDKKQEEVYIVKFVEVKEEVLHTT